MNVRVPFNAAGTPPDTGASIICGYCREQHSAAAGWSITLSAISATSLAVSGSIVDESIRILG